MSVIDRFSPVVTSLFGQKKIHLNIQVMCGLYNSFQNHSGFLNAITSSLKRFLKGVIKLVNIFKEASKTWYLIFLAIRTPKKLKNRQHIYRKYGTQL
jgi:hypothetical protein